jgi:hypothetical protein
LQEGVSRPPSAKVQGSMVKQQFAGGQVGRAIEDWEGLRRFDT